MGDETWNDLRGSMKRARLVCANQFLSRVRSHPKSDMRPFHDFGAAHNQTNSDGLADADASHRIPEELFEPHRLHHIQTANKFHCGRDLAQSPNLLRQQEEATFGVRRLQEWLAAQPRS
jgi:hypothetical protein